MLPPRRIALVALVALVLAVACTGGTKRSGTPVSTREASTPAVAGAPPSAAGTGTARGPIVAAVRSIVEVRRLPLGSAAAVSGAVTAAPTVFDSRGRKLYVQDDTGGIAVFFAGGLKAQEGDTVTLAGTLTAFNSELEIVLSSENALRATGRAGSVAPRTINTGEITASDYGRLVTVSGGVQAVRGPSLWIDDGSGGVQAYAVPRDVDLAAIRPGDAVTVTGISSRSKGQLQVLPRRGGDVQARGRWTDPEAAPRSIARGASSRPEAAAVRIVAFYPHTYQDRVNEESEAIRLQNTGTAPVDLSGWALTDNRQLAIFRPGTTLAPSQQVWITRSVSRFTVEFGSTPDWVFGDGDCPAAGCVPPHTEGGAPAPIALLGGQLHFANSGGAVALLDPEGAVADAVVYGLGDTSQPGWRGPALQPYLFDYFVPPAGQVFQRKLDQRTAAPIADTDSARDWMVDPEDGVNGRRLLYAGWSFDRFFTPASAEEEATTQFLLAPDNLFEGVAALVDSARESIDIEVYTFASPQLLAHITARQKAGVKVRALFDGGVYNSPDGTYDEDRWTAQQIVANGGQAWFWMDDPADRVPARYNNHHQKFMIVDGRRVLITSENFEQTSLPADPKTNGTGGNRGSAIITDAPTVVARLRDVFAQDADPARKDIQPVDRSARYQPPVDKGDQSGYTIVQPAPLTVSGRTRFEVVQSPESSLRSVDALIGMVGRAGAGDTVLVEQQYEYASWGTNYPNPRLAAYITAARRGASVLVLLDAVNDAAQNQRTIDQLRTLATRDGLKIEGRLAKPAGGPIHNKMVLVTSGADAWVHVSSINGSENASIFNREMGVQVQSLDGYRYFARAFAADWKGAGGQLPVDAR